MGHRLSRIVTKTGDDGSTGLADGSRVRKDSLRIIAIGEIDELNCCIGVARAYELPQDVDDLLSGVQNDLFDLGGELSFPGHRIVADDDAIRLERALERLNLDLPLLKEFVLPSGGHAVSACHLARAVCRRAERAVVSLARSDGLPPAIGIYLNRLSDLLFVIARTVACRQGSPEIAWKKRRNPRIQEGDG